MYKVTVYSGDREEYFTFCTPECTKEIDSYLEYRKRRGEHITENSYLLVRKFSPVTKVKGKPFKGKALPSILQECIDNSGLREINHTNPYKRKTIKVNLQHRMMASLAHVMNVEILCPSIQHIMNQK